MILCGPLSSHLVNLGRALRVKVHFYSKFIDRLYDTAQVMTEYLAKRLVDLRPLRLKSW
jgi:hypothetical protein